MGLFAAAASGGAGCSVKVADVTSSSSSSTSSSMGTGGTGSTSTAGVTASASTGGTCMDQAGCKKCGACVGMCGTPVNPATNNLCCASYDKYVALFDCACGQDGMSGACGTKCSKTCVNMGMDDASCMTCLAAALSGTCNSSYTTCQGDTGM